MMRQLWGSAMRGLWVLTHRRTRDRELTEELSHFFAMAEAEHLRSGLSHAAARQAARREFGNPHLAREVARAFGWERGLSNRVTDVRYAARRLSRNREFAIASVFTLALGIGTSTVIFSVVNPILIRALPYPNAGKLVLLSDRGHRGEYIPATYGTFSELRARARSFEGLAAADLWQPSLDDAQASERLEGQRITSNYFATLEVAPIAGRIFVPQDDAVGGPAVVIVSERLARRRFGRARLGVGSVLLLDNAAYRIIGVMPARFTDVLAPAAEIWTPMQARSHAPFNAREWGHHYQIVGRLAQHADDSVARVEMEAIGGAPAEGFPRPAWAAMETGLVVRSLHDAVTATSRGTLLVIVGAALLLVATACVSVTELLLTRGDQRRSAFARRAAQQAGHWRLVRQLTSESVVLTAIGGVLGLAFAWLGLHAFQWLDPSWLPRLNAVRLDTQAILFSCAITMLIGLGVAAAPTWGIIRDVRRQRARREIRPPRRGLVVAEIAFALVLMVGAGLLTRSLAHLRSVIPGFDSARVLTLQISGSGAGMRTDAERHRYYASVLERVRAVPGVTAAAFTSTLPLDGDGDAYGFALESRPGLQAGDAGSAVRYSVTPEYFEAMGITLLSGRVIQASDTLDAVEAIVVSESFARSMFGAENPIGERVRFGPEAEGTRGWDVIVGVAADVKQTSLTLDARPAFYVSTSQWWWVDNVQSLVVRTAADAGSFAPAVTAAVRSVDPTPAVQRIATMDALVATSAAERRFTLAAIAGFATLALVLVVSGMYRASRGCIAGLRVRSADLRRSILRMNASTTALGVLFGLAGAMVASRQLEALLFGVSAIDPATYAVVIAAIVVLSGITSWLPARHSLTG